MSHAHYLVAKGELVRRASCEECGKTLPPNRRGAAQIQAHHHNGYDNPLDVQWLCPTCHLQANQSGREVEPDPLGCILTE
jgi:hypothetical protein